VLAVVEDVVGAGSAVEGPLVIEVEAVAGPAVAAVVVVEVLVTGRRLCLPDQMTETGGALRLEGARDGDSKPLPDLLAVAAGAVELEDAKAEAVPAVPVVPVVMGFVAREYS
jgi:hypothetical protein